LYLFLASIAFVAPQSQPVRANPKTPAQIGVDMRQRHYRARVWLNENEYKQFIRNVEKTGLSKETYLRQLIIGYEPKELPSFQQRRLIISLTKVVNELCSICHETNNNKNYYSELIQEISDVLMKMLLSIEQAYL
jgi:hypothetical protein